MPYCDVDDLKTRIPEERLIELTDDEGVGMVNLGRVSEAITKADGTIDSYLAERYAVPLNPCPVIIKSASEDLAIYNLYTRTQDVVPESRQKANDNAVKLLEKIAAGKLSLGVADPPEETNTGGISVTAPEPIFPDSELDKF